jgi:hypothetical protein
VGGAFDEGGGAVALGDDKLDAALGLLDGELDGEADGGHAGGDEVGGGGRDGDEDLAADVVGVDVVGHVRVARLEVLERMTVTRVEKNNRCVSFGTRRVETEGVSKSEDIEMNSKADSHPGTKQA